jgi:hypothetical protein
MMYIFTNVTVYTYDIKILFDIHLNVCIIIYYTKCCYFTHYRYRICKKYIKRKHICIIHLLNIMHLQYWYKRVQLCIIICIFFVYQRERKTRAETGGLAPPPIAFLSFVVTTVQLVHLHYAERVNHGVNDALPYLGMGGEKGRRWWVSYRDMVE